MSVSKKQKLKIYWFKQPPQQRLKVSDIPAMALQIGTWKRVSTAEYDLMAKCFFVKKCFLWEFWESATVKKRIKVPWDNISSIRAFIEDDQLATMQVELSKIPSFFHELDSQPRKHSRWTATTDFTEGQALASRIHVLRFHPQVLSILYEKLELYAPWLLQRSNQGSTQLGCNQGSTSSISGENQSMQIMNSYASRIQPNPIFSNQIPHEANPKFSPPNHVFQSSGGAYMSHDVSSQLPTESEGYINNPQLNPVTCMPIESHYDTFQGPSELPSEVVRATQVNPAFLSRINRLRTYGGDDGSWNNCSSQIQNQQAVTDLNTQVNQDYSYHNLSEGHKSSSSVLNDAAAAAQFSWNSKMSPVNLRPANHEYTLDEIFGEENINPLLPSQGSHGQLRNGAPEVHYTQNFATPAAAPAPEGNPFLGLYTTDNIGRESMEHTAAATAAAPAAEGNPFLGSYTTDNIGSKHH